MEQISNLFFELSHEDRLGILHILMKTPMKLTNIASEMGCSSQEAYRHLSRLIDAGLAEKNSDGDYVITHFGLQVMRLEPGYRFLSDYSEYFKTRDLSLITDQFMSRIGELIGATLVNDVMVTIFDMDIMIKEAEEYIYILIDQMVMNQYKPILEATERGVKIRVMRPKGWKLPDNIAKRIGDDTLRGILRQINSGIIAQREPDVLPAFLALSEKEVSVIAFANLDQELDYLGFKSDDPKTHRWCLDLYEDIWKSAHRGEIRTNIE